MASTLVLRSFETVAVRFKTAQAQVQSHRDMGCECVSLGQQVDCQNCPIFKAYIWQLQRQLKGVDPEELPQFEMPTLQRPYSTTVQQHCVELFRQGFSMGEVQHLTGVTNRRDLRKWFYAEGLLKRYLSPELRKQCLQLYTEGLSGQEIEDRLRVGADVISHLVSTAGLSRSKAMYSEQQRQQSLLLYQQGLPLADIEAATGVYGPTVRAWGKAAKLDRPRQKRPGRPRVYSEAFRQECFDLVDSGWTLGQVELEKGVGAGTIRKWAKQVGRQLPSPKRH